ncbi:hypothetical protein [Kaarinaea lacus]
MIRLPNTGRLILKNSAYPMLHRYSICFLLFLVSLSCLSAEQREIVLKDGSVITGEVQKFDGKQYTISSPSLGTVNINNAEVSAIRTPKSATENNTNGMAISPGDISAMQQQLMSNQEIMALINSLQNDPEVQAILNDPEVMQAIFAGNIQVLLNNPKFKDLLDNPTIKSIAEKSAQ